MQLSSTLHAAKSGSVQLGAWQMPLVVYDMLIICYENNFELRH
jgi:hypothetical protein